MTLERERNALSPEIINDHERSSEEEDHLARSNKKVKNSHEESPDLMQTEGVQEHLGTHESNNPTKRKNDENPLPQKKSPCPIKKLWEIVEIMRYSLMKMLKISPSLGKGRKK